MDKAAPAVGMGAGNVQSASPTAPGQTHSFLLQFPKDISDESESAFTQRQAGPYRFYGPIELPQAPKDLPTFLAFAALNVQRFIAMSRLERPKPGEIPFGRSGIWGPRLRKLTPSYPTGSRTGLLLYPAAEIIETEILLALWVALCLSAARDGTAGGIIPDDPLEGCEKLVGPRQARSWHGRQASAFRSDRFEGRQRQRHCLHSSTEYVEGLVLYI